ncbi:MAG: hypothetical protein ABJA90_11320 [Ginsengibacter sp.]
MKRILVSLFCFFTMMAETNAQLHTAKPIPGKSGYDLLLKKARNQKTIAWVFLGGGIGLAITGAVVGTNSVDNVGSQPIDKLDAGLQTGSKLLLAGGACMAASIPFFISSGKNRRRASVVLKNESTSFLRQLHYSGSFLAVGIHVNL